MRGFKAASKRRPEVRGWHATAAVFLCVFLYVEWIAAARVFLGNNDEGIYLAGALQMLRGEMPFRDFFALTGPGTFALQAASMYTAGLSLAAARLPLVFDVAAMTACVFWLTLKLSGRFTAALTAFAFVAFELGLPSLASNHRWDSSAWALLAATLIFFALDSKNARASAIACLAAGFSAALAAWCTPPVAIVCLALALCLIRRDLAPMLAAYVGGLAAGFAGGLALLAANGALRPMIDSIRWTLTNYSGVNRTPYAWVIGGYGNLFRDVSPVQFAITLALMFFLTLPATLPFVSLIWVWKKQATRGVAVLLAASAALIVSTYPRWDLLHLVYVAGPAYALNAPLIGRWRFARAAGVAALLAASALVGIAIDQRLAEKSERTVVGTIHGPAADLQMMDILQRHVRPMETMFVFPYRPVAYFLTLARNPTRYSFLQPGMFPESDETQVLEELRSDPPHWVLYMDLAPDQFLRIWPASDPKRLRMPRIETFLKTEYRKVDEGGGFDLLEWRGGVSAGLR